MGFNTRRAFWFIYLQQTRSVLKVKGSDYGEKCLILQNLSLIWIKFRIRIEKVPTIIMESTIKRAINTLSFK